LTWITCSFAALVSIYVIAVVAGRSTRTIPQKIAFASGILGLLGIPALVIAAVRSFCVAGACRDGMGPADYIGIVCLALAATSFISLVVVGVRRPRA